MFKPLFRLPGSSNWGLPVHPGYVSAGQTGFVLKTTAGQSPRPLTLDEAIQQQQRERELAAWASWEAKQARKRRTEKKYTPSPSSASSRQAPPYQRQRYERYAEVHELYDSLVHGDPQTPRVVPFAIARSSGLFTEEIALLTHQAMEKTQLAKLEFTTKYVKQEYDSYIRWRIGDAQYLERQLQEVRDKIQTADSPNATDDFLERNRRNDTIADLYRQRNDLTHRLEKSERIDLSSLEHRRCAVRVFPRSSIQSRDKTLWSVNNIYKNYVWLQSFSDIWNLLAPYSAAQFTTESKRLLPNIENLIVQIDNRFKQPPIGHPLFEPWIDSGRYMKGSVVKSLKRFLQQYREGALVMLSLLDSAGMSNWNGVGYVKPGKYFSSSQVNYYSLCMLDFPAISGVDPIELLKVAKKLNGFMLASHNSHIFLNCFDDRITTSFDRLTHIYLWKICQRAPDKDQKDSDFEKLDKAGFHFYVHELQMDTEKQEVVRFLQTTLQDRWDWFEKHSPTAASQWIRSDELTRSYLLSRAWEIIYYGENIANSTFPQPRFLGADLLVSALVTLLNDTEARLLEAKQSELDARLRKEEAEKLEEIKQKCEKAIAKISHAPPDHLAPRVLNENEIEAVKVACLRELSQIEK